jgi:phosphate-selective porin OprO/OprP
MNIQSDIVESPRLDIQDKRLSIGAAYYIVKTQNHDNVFVSETNHRTLTPSFSGWDVDVDYFLTNDYKPFDTAAGYYSTVVPRTPLNRGGWGAWQIAARLDNADLNDIKYGIRGGNETNFTAALNWYPINSVRIMLNYIKVFPLGGGTFNGQAPTIVVSRLQFLF